MNVNQYIDAIVALYPNVVVIDVEGAKDEEGNLVTLDEDAVKAWIPEDQWSKDRKANYPSIGDQLDALYHAGLFPDDMAAEIKAVKDAYPKPSE